VTTDELGSKRLDSLSIVVSYKVLPEKSERVNSLGQYTYAKIL